MNNIFISHSSKDNLVAEKLKALLVTEGHRGVFLDFDPEKGIPAGRNWEKELYSQLRKCRAVIVLCSRHSMKSYWCFAEITHAKALGKEIFPIKIDDCSIHSLLQGYQIIDLTENTPVAHQRLWQGLRQAGLDPNDLFGWDSSRPPYPGLMAFQEKDAAVYFGRKDDIRKILDELNRLRQYGGHRLVLILGSSGSGKSSLMQAGLLPRIRSAGDAWIVVGPFRPLNRPFERFAKSLAKSFDQYGEHHNFKPICKRLSHCINSNPVDPNVVMDFASELQEAAETDEATVLIAIDQMEELLNPDLGNSGHCFLKLLCTTTVQSLGPVMVIGTLRSDYLGAFQQHPAVRGLSFESLSVGTMAIENIAEVITGPARVAGIELEDGLVQAIVDDAEAEDSLPLMAFTLRKLWDNCGAEGLLTLHEYRQELGGLDGAVAQAAESVFAALPEQNRAQIESELRGAFLKMVHVDEEGKYARRITNWNQLPVDVHGWLENFVHARLLVSDIEGQERTLEVAHEALFRAWQRFSDWLAADREFLLWKRRFESACRDWVRTGKDQGTLLRGAPLAEAEGWFDRYSDRIGEQERSFFYASKQNHEAEKRRREAYLQRAREIQRLSDHKKIQNLKDKADRLWPAWPDRISQYEEWLKEAQTLLSNLDEHKQTLAKLREKAVSTVEKVQSWQFASEDDAWWHDTLAEVVDGLESLNDQENGLVSGIDLSHGLSIKRRLAFARAVEKLSLTGMEAQRKWQDAVASIKSMAVYGGLQIKPVQGMLPLGQDSLSGLWEFAHLQTGNIPARKPDGKLIMTEDSCLIFVLIPGGTFWMGSQKTDPEGPNFDLNAQHDESPVRRLHLSPFFMSKFQMTQGQWLRFTGRNPSRYQPGNWFGNETYTLLNPVEQVTWEDCDLVLRRLGLTLPTEAQWEYAARGGTTTPWWTGGDKSSLRIAANLSDRHYQSVGGPIDWSYEDWDDGYALHAPVGSYAANPFGLHDVHGNVWEWCIDRYGNYELPTRENNGERLQTDSIKRIFRGGCYYRTSVSARSALRRSNTSNHQIDYLGVRPARDLFN